MDSVNSAETPAIEPYLVDVAGYIEGLNILLQDTSKSRSIESAAKIFMVWDGKSLRCTKNGLRVISAIKEGSGILKTFNDGGEHWDWKETRKRFRTMKVALIPSGRPIIPENM